MKIKTLPVAALLLTAGLSVAPHAQAQDAGRLPCIAGKIVGVCSDERGPATLQAGWYRAVRFGPRRRAPNAFLQLVKLFIDDLQVAEMGGMRVKLNISIR